ncbi:MAG: tRNA 2-thiouridine(34) synthase MnmA [Clostridia bacterium]|nr:tRNA 2-thiouridine(34) synthase MnmA [Clostridia bacterium]
MTKIFVGISGGVDSAVAALLLKEQGFDVVGFTLLLAGNDETERAATVCRQLDIPHRIIDLKEDFVKYVSSPFLDIYSKGLTPNPCILCNKHIKFGAAVDAIGNQADFIATGHYASVICDPVSGRRTFRKSTDITKDQTYMFWTLSQKQIEKVKMPLGEYTKEQVRQLAEGYGLEAAGSPDSQDICFLKDISIRDYIAANRPEILKPGDIVDPDGMLLGKHTGVAGYTLGQRKGLGVASDGKKYVVEIDAENNRVVLGENSHLFSKKLIAQNANFLTLEQLTHPISVEAKIRYAAKPAKAIVSPFGDKIVVEFEEPQRAITPGQSVVFYNGDILVGGGEILKAE